MLLSDDKVTHLSHVILNFLKGSPLATLAGDEGAALREIKRVLASELAQEEDLDRIVRGRLASYSRPILEGTPEWDVLYQKTYEEERRRRSRS